MLSDHSDSWRTHGRTAAVTSPGAGAGSAAAVDTTAAASGRVGVARAWAFQHIDVVFAVVAAVLVIVLGGPAVGAAFGAGGWILQRIVAVVDAGWARRLREPRQQLGVSLFERFGRIWLLAGAIVVASLVGKRADGLVAALIIMAAYSVAFVIRLTSGPPPGRGSDA